jgi:hypothetical protein
MERNGLAKLAKPVTKDVAARYSEDHSRTASRLQKTMPVAALELVELLLAERRSKRRARNSARPDYSCLGRRWSTCVTVSR